MKKYVIYTILAGQYGDVHQPLCADSRFDYVLFSNNFKEKKVGLWEVRPIPIPDGVDNTDNKRLSRYPKTHPETMLSEYEVSLYMDANIQIADQWVYDRVVELAEQSIEFAGIKLIATGRDCIYDHSYDMCFVRAEHDYNAIKQMHALYKEGFPTHFGLNENNVIYRSHTDRMRKVDELWWDWIVKYSYRDQFSFMFCLWKYQIPLVYFLPEGEDAHSTSHFKFYFHNDRPEVASKKWVKQGLLERMRNVSRNLSKHHYEHYRAQWGRICKKSHPEVWLNALGVLAFIGTIIQYIPVKVAIQIRKLFKK